MKVVILAGGRGTRISEESVSRPKPMVEIGKKPILWHIMKIYSSYGFNDFIICCGYKGHMIKQYFVNYHMHQADTTYSLEDAKVEYSTDITENWRVTLADTGEDTLTAGRILAIKEYLCNDDEFMLTYGDGVADININELIDFHHQHGKTATITTTQPAGRFGAIKIDDGDIIDSFKEKARKDQSWVNAGFMVLNRKVFDYLGDGSEMLEAGPFEQLAADKEMAAYRHYGFWSPMDTIHDRAYLEELWSSGQAPWKIW
jgi:glucose-1-phosphate cytidylyltransferase